jgi:hypothetical protein
MFEDCPDGNHVWETEPLFDDHPEYLGCERCQALGIREADKVVVVKCSNPGCINAAITLCADQDMKPVCDSHFTGVIAI